MGNRNSGSARISGEAASTARVRGADESGGGGSGGGGSGGGGGGGSGSSSGKSVIKFVRPVEDGGDMRTDFAGEEAGGRRQQWRKVSTGCTDRRGEERERDINNTIVPDRQRPPIKLKVILPPSECHPFVRGSFR